MFTYLFVLQIIEHLLHALGKTRCSGMIPPSKEIIKYKRNCDTGIKTTTTTTVLYGRKWWEPQEEKGQVPQKFRDTGVSSGWKSKVPWNRQWLRRALKGPRQEALQGPNPCLPLQPFSPASFTPASAALNFFSFLHWVLLPEASSDLWLYLWVFLLPGSFSSKLPKPTPSPCSPRLLTYSSFGLWA